MSTEPTIGLVVERTETSRRIRKRLETTSFRLTFEIPLDRVEECKLDPDILIVDAASADDGFLDRIKARFDSQPLLLCTVSNGRRVLKRVLDGQVQGVVFMDDLDRTLEPTIRSLAAGQLVMPQEMARMNRLPDLTKREKQVMSLVVMGLSNHEIGRKLYVSENTVKSHLQSAYRKLDVHSRAEAVRRIADPNEGLGTGILAITSPGLARARNGPTSSRDEP